MCKKKRESAMPARSTSLTLKQLAAVAGLLVMIATGVASAVAYIHADVIVPRILNETRKQAIDLIDRHVERTSAALAGALTEREFRMWADQINKRLERLEVAGRAK